MGRISAKKTSDTQTAPTGEEFQHSKQLTMSALITVISNFCDKIKGSRTLSAILRLTMRMIVAIRSSHNLCNCLYIPHVSLLIILSDSVIRGLFTN